MFDSHLVVGEIANLLWNDPIVNKLSFARNVDLPKSMTIEVYVEDGRFIRWVIPDEEMLENNTIGYENYAIYITENILFKIKGGI